VGVDVVHVLLGHLAVGERHLERLGQPGALGVRGRDVVRVARGSVPDTHAPPYVPSSGQRPAPLVARSRSCGAYPASSA
jgi:hypothetical protein